ncbi:MAG: DUF6152 family protein [Candidatus Rariloculaceae bacterium]
MVFAIATLGAAPVHAHHAASATFDVNEAIEIEGYVDEFVFKNPHVNLFLTVIDDEGVETQWLATAPATAPMRRWGWTEDIIQEGQYLRLLGRPRRDGGPMILVDGQPFREGIDTVFEIDPADGSVIRALGANPVDMRTAEMLAPMLSDGRPNLTGTWLGSVGGSTNRTPPPWNEVGAAIQATFDSATDPAFTECEAPGLVRTVMTINSVEIEQHDDWVSVTFEGGGEGRLINLNGRGPETDEHMRLGHAVARYENDALVIETTQLESRLSLITGNLLSNQTTTVETYRRADDPERGPLLELSLVITDPVYLDGPWEMRWHKPYAADEYEFTGLDCRVPLGARSN